MARSGVTLRTQQDKVLVFLSEDSNFEDLLARLRSKLREGLAPSRRAEVLVDVGRRVLSEAELASLERTIKEDRRLTLASVVDSIDMASRPDWWPSFPQETDEPPDAELVPDGSGSAGTNDGSVTRIPIVDFRGVPAHEDVTVDGSEDEGRETPNRDSPSREGSSRQGSSREESGASANAYLFKSTLRSGQEIAFGGDVVILGDVNSGAKVVAGGDVVVIGSLRGVVHAGAGGNKDAKVTALDMHPTQLRIAGVIARPPEGERQVPRGPEQARISDGTVVLERLRRFSRTREGGKME